MVISRWGASKSRFHPGPVMCHLTCSPTGPDHTSDPDSVSRRLHHANKSTVEFGQKHDVSISTSSSSRIGNNEHPTTKSYVAWASSNPNGHEKNIRNNPYEAVKLPICSPTGPNHTSDLDTVSGTTGMSTAHNTQSFETVTSTIWTQMFQTNIPTIWTLLESKQLTVSMILSLSVFAMCTLITINMTQRSQPTVHTDHKPHESKSNVRFRSETTDHSYTHSDSVHGTLSFTLLLAAGTSTNTVPPSWADVTRPRSDAVTEIQSQPTLNAGNSADTVESSADLTPQQQKATQKYDNHKTDIYIHS